MLNTCPNHSRECYPKGTNVIGIAVESYSAKNGLVQTGETRLARCQVAEDLRMAPNDGVERRAYCVLDKESLK